MTTTLYFHSDSSTVSGTLPTTEQSSRTATKNMDAQTVNRSMDTTIGISQTDISAAVAATSNPSIIYITKFVSLPLASGSSSISANTWTYSWASNVSGSGNNWPSGVTSGAGGAFPSTLYVWRPSTGAKIGNIFDGNSSSSTVFNSSTTEKGIVVTFTGSAVTGATGDVLIFEAWANSSLNATSRTFHYYVDGTSSSITDNTATSNAASNISTPQTLTFTGPIVCTPTSKVVAYKFIFKQ